MRLFLRNLGLMVVALLLCAGQPAAAQEKPKSLLELLFPRSSQKPPEKAAPKKPKAKAQKPRVRSVSKAAVNTQNSAPASLMGAPGAPVLPAEKLANAKKILVVGDFLASGTAAGLNTTFEQSPGVVIIDASNGSSGLVRDDFYNWPTEIGTLIAMHQPSIVVAMLGANDRQQLVVSGKREEVRSVAWLADYRSRVRTLANAVTSRNIPLVWIGQVPFRSNAMTADMLALNDIFRETADNEKIGSSYIDVWEGFVDETGTFIERGPDINGQNVALRSGQVNVTKAGFRKIAFYAERSLNRLLGDTASTQLGTLSEDNLPQISLGLPGIEANFERMRPIDLLDNATSDELSGAIFKPLTAQPRPLETAAPLGRIDNLQSRP